MVGRNWMVGKSRIMGKSWMVSRSWISSRKLRLMSRLGKSWVTGARRGFAEGRGQPLPQ